MKKYQSLPAAFFFILGLFARPVHAQVKPAFEHVILISVDGFRPDAISALGPEGAPAFYEFIKNGASTLNARTDVDYTVTMPDHLCMLTGLGVNGEQGHNYTINDDTGKTFHEIKGRYVPSIFDVTSTSHSSSAFFATKSKFMLYAKSYGAKGIPPQPDIAYQEKYLIDAFYVAQQNDDAVANIFLEHLTASAPQFIFLHLSGTDKTGHIDGWDVGLDSSYMKEVRNIDGIIGKILQAIRGNDKLARSTAVIITSDHGGTGNEHSDSTEARNYTIPFLVWGAAIAPGSDLYALNKNTRQDPGQGQTGYDAPRQPIRNGDAANLALSLLGLPAVPGSTINRLQDLNALK